MTTRQYCLSLLHSVDDAGRDPELAYLVRTRLRRAMIALERGRHDHPAEPLLDQAPRTIQTLVKDLTARVIWLCQPSEALDVRWQREWSSVLDGVGQVRQWLELENP